MGLLLLLGAPALAGLLVGYFVEKLITKMERHCCHDEINHELF